MKYDLAAQGWIQKIIRVRKEVLPVISYLEFIARQQNIDFCIYTNQVFIKALDILITDGFHYNMSEYLPRRIPKGFVIDGDTAKLFDSTLKHYEGYFMSNTKRRLYIADFTELLLYIYCMNELNEYQKSQINIAWGILDTRQLIK